MSDENITLRNPQYAYEKIPRRTRSSEGIHSKNGDEYFTKKACIQSLWSYNTAAMIMNTTVRQ